MAMIERERLEQLSQPLIQVYNVLQTSMIENMAKELGKDNDLLQSDPSRWEARQLNKLNAIKERNADELARLTGGNRDAIQEALDKASKEGVEPNEEALRKALEDGKDLSEPVPLAEDEAVQEILDGYQAQANDTLRSVNNTLLDQSEETYRNMLTRASADVRAGVKSPEQALRDTVREWSHKGMPALIRSDGAEMSPEGYVRTVMRTMSNRVTNDIQEKRFDEWGVDLVEVSSHVGARPKCEPHQGKVYSRGGDSDNYPPLSSTSMGEKDGLFGINCRHVKYPYFPGQSKQQNEPVNKTENDRAYKNSQKQRNIERKIRQAKSEKRTMEALGDEEGVKQANERMRLQQSNMRKFADDTGRTRRREREQIH
ncbi:phage minor capsid protein [Salsuginibacillus halophilus]|nr:phage minor capsid protein [Salsuginibacillus halophilus]